MMPARRAILVGMRHSVLVVVAVLATFACATAAASFEGERTRAAAGRSLPRPVRLARNDAAHRRHLRAAQVRVVSVKRRTWPDSCLGLGGREFCAQVLVKGYRAVFVVRGRRLVYRTDLTSVYRLES
jgi:Tfp pilus assembly protein FimT